MTSAREDRFEDFGARDVCLPAVCALRNLGRARGGMMAVRRGFAVSSSIEGNPRPRIASEHSLPAAPVYAEKLKRNCPSRLRLRPH
jgi:hypothetical protein